MKRILVCEDEDAIRDFVVINLVRSGYDVVDVSCGEDAVKVYTEQNGNFDVALLDIMMPGMDGFALCRWIREQSSEIGIIMLSAKSQEMDKVNCLMIGADDYVTKPFSPSELVARVDAIYRRVNVSQSLHAGSPEPHRAQERRAGGADPGGIPHHGVSAQEPRHRAGQKDDTPPYLGRGLLR